MSQPAVGVKSLSPSRLFARSRTRVSIPLVLLALLGESLVAGGRYPAPFTQGERLVSADQLLPSVWGMLLGAFVLRAQPELEWGAKSRLRSARSCWLIALAAAAFVLVAAVSLLADPDLVGQMFRNVLCFLGVALISATFLGAGPAWAPVFLVTGVTWFFGYHPDTGQPRAWAWLLTGSDSLFSWAFCAFLGLAGALLYVYRDTRPVAGMADG